MERCYNPAQVGDFGRMATHSFYLERANTFEGNGVLDEGGESTAGAERSDGEKREVATGIGQGTTEARGGGSGNTFRVGGDYGHGGVTQMATSYYTSFVTEGMRHGVSREAAVVPAKDGLDGGSVRVRGDEF